LAYRELDEALGLTETGAELLADSRLGSNKQHRLVPLLRQSIYSRLAGYEDVNDAERLAIDPAMRYVVGGRAALADKYAASTSEVGRFETDILSTKDNQTRLQLFVLAYNLANFLRRLALPQEIDHWSLTTLREKLVKTGAKVVRHAKYVTFQLAEIAVPRRLFAAILDRIARLAIPPPGVAATRG